MTKQQLREAIRRVIKQELLNEALGFLPPMQVAYFEGYDDAKKGKPANVNYFRKHMELDETSLNEMPGLKIFNKDDSALEAFKKGYKYGFKDGRLGEMTLKNALSLEENQWEPEIAEPDVDTDTETEEDDYTFTPDPGSLPNVAPKATAKEMSAIADLVRMYKAEKANLNELNKKRKK